METQHIIILLISSITALAGLLVSLVSYLTAKKIKKDWKEDVRQIKARHSEAVSQIKYRHSKELARLEKEYRKDLLDKIGFYEIEADKRYLKHPFAKVELLSFAISEEPWHPGNIGGRAIATDRYSTVEFKPKEQPFNVDLADPKIPMRYIKDQIANETAKFLLENNFIELELKEDRGFMRGRFVLNYFDSMK